MFATTADYDGNLGGLDGADAICQDFADTYSIGPRGTYRAWLSDSTGSPATRFRCHAASCSSQGYTKPGGAIIASDWADLTDGVLSVAISNGGDYTWTNTLPDGTPGGESEDGHCGNWLVSNALNGNYGWANQVTSEWTVVSHAGCGLEVQLYCFQQS